MEKIFSIAELMKWQIELIDKGIITNDDVKVIADIIAKEK